MRHAVFDVSKKAARQVQTLKGVAMTDEGGERSVVRRTEKTAG